MTYPLASFSLWGMRRSLALAHRWTGLCLGLVFFLVCASGTLLVWEDEITDFLDRALITQSSQEARTQSSQEARTQSSQGAPSQSNQEARTQSNQEARTQSNQEAPTQSNQPTPSLTVIEKAVKAQLLPQEQIKRFYLPPGKVRVQGPEGRRILYFHPQDGRFLGEGSQRMRQVEIFHRRLFLGDTGRWITLVSATGVFFLLLSGLKLWWPINKKGWGQAFVIKGSGSRRRLFFDIHRVGGVIVALPLLLIVVTGWNYSKLARPYRSAIMTITAAPAPPARIKAKFPGKRVASLDDALLAAQDAFPEASLSFLDYPSSDSRLVEVAMRHPWEPGSMGNSAVEFDLSTGEVRRKTHALEMPLGHQLVSVWALPLHRGRAFGWPQRLLWMFVSIMGMLLPLTGAWLWYRKGKKS